MSARVSLKLVAACGMILLPIIAEASGVGTRGGMPPAPRPNTPELANEYNCVVTLETYGEERFKAELKLNGITPIYTRTEAKDWQITSKGEAMPAESFPMGLEHNFTVAATHDGKNWLDLQMTADWGFFSDVDKVEVRNTASTSVALDSKAPLKLSSYVWVKEHELQWNTSFVCNYVGEGRRFDTTQAKKIVDALVKVSPSEKEIWQVSAIKCNHSEMEIVGGPNGEPFTHREFNDCQLVVNGAELQIAAELAKELIAALDIDWVRDYKSSSGVTLSLSTLNCSRQVNRFIGERNECSGRK